MPVYNRASVVRRAIDSVLAQHFDDFELIVVDDGSSDGSADLVAAVADPRLRLVRLPTNGGGNAARNRGIHEARGSIVAFLDSDDYYLPHKLGVVDRFFRERTDVDVLIDSFIKVYPPADGRPNTPRHNPVIDDNEAFLEALFMRRIWKATPGISARREAVIRAGLFDESLKRRQDYDFMLRLAEVARCASTDELLWIKTNSPDAISASVDTGVAALVDFYQRHPNYHGAAAFRRGFALDMARHFIRCAGRGRLDRMARDSRTLTDLLGYRRFAAMMVEGQFLRAARTRRIAKGER
jgi:glycosyltransferase involved in cell wall biosynthesis